MPAPSSSSSSDDDDLVVERPQSSRRSKRNLVKKRVSTKRRVSVLESLNDDDEEEEEEEEESHNEAGGKRRVASRPSRASSTTRKRLASQRLVSRRSAPSKGQQPSVAATSSSWKRRRISSPRKQHKPKRVLRDEDSNSDSTPTDRQQQQGDSSDDEWYMDNQADESSNEKSENEGESDEESVKAVVRKSPRRVGIVKDDFGDSEESSSSASEYESPNLKPSQASKTSSRLYESSDGSSSEEEAARRDSFSPEKCIHCTSTEDAVTAEPLPRIHVCFVPKSGDENKQCFSLETLRKIALSVNNTSAISDDGTKQTTFLQPPHFRSAMSDEMLDQIASRFGRTALDIHGPFYNQKDPSSNANHHAWPAHGGLRTQHYEHNAHHDADNFFLERLEEYKKNQMGSRDLYCCPICYVVASKRLHSKGRQTKINEKNSKKKNDGDLDAYTVEIEEDPISVLGAPDDHHYDVAGGFCFRTVAKVKQHLREEHGVSTKEIEGIDLYAAFKVRAPDGLLQRYLKRDSKKYGNEIISKSGWMVRYWNQGNNTEFLYILETVEKLEHAREVLKSTSNFSEDEINEADGLILPLNEYISSFSNIAKELWGKISGPYQMGADDLDDFLAADDDEVDHEPMSYQALAFQQAQQDAIEDDKRIRSIQEKRMSGEGRSRASSFLLGTDGENEDDEDEISDEEPDDIVLPSDYHESSSSSDEDEWLSSRRDSSAVKKKRLSSSSRPTPIKRIVKKGREIDDDDDSGDSVFGADTAGPNSSSHSKGSARRRSILDDSDDNGGM